MSKIIHPNPPKIYLVRAQLAGIHCGELVEFDKPCRIVLLRNAHRIWRWRGANTLTELARGGGDKSWTRVSERTPGDQYIFEVFELLEVTDAAVADNLRSPRWPA